MNFVEADHYLSGGRDKNSRPIANNTRVVRLDADRIAIRLHATDVVTFDRGGTTTLDTGGWYTVTTKDRINGYMNDGESRLGVYSDKGRWFIFDRASWPTPWTKVARFFDGIQIHDGKVLNAMPEAKERKQAAAEEAMKKRIRKYLDGYMATFVKGMPQPSGGDCWYCVMHDVNDPKRSMGDFTGDTEHLTSHMTERYYVPALLLNAMREKGYKDVGIAMFLGIYGRTDGLMGGGDRASNQPVRRALRDYLSRRLIGGTTGARPSVPGHPSTTGRY